MQRVKQHQQIEFMFLYKKKKFFAYLYYIKTLLIALLRIHSFKLFEIIT